MARTSLCADCAALLKTPGAARVPGHLKLQGPEHQEAGISYRHYQCETCNRKWSQGSDSLKGAYRWTLQALPNKHLASYNRLPAMVS
ncbi:hypothetical protein [Andreprevotia sp. IGB-42]|uniref:hypothetical protein n=1 Tax=Andreprevotia sp. IGB-42 TaxID=2497473 RepID=UPI001359D61D|nr:hypothetical protein [Andreprevotia sp. IGB-42]